MKQLHGIDASFLHMESASLPMHILKVFVFSGHPPDLEEIRGHLDEATRRFPALNQRVVSLPLGLGQPIFVTDAGLELEHHVRFTDLASPGSATQLDALLGELAEGMLPRDRPLWQLTIVRGLAGGRWAAIAKVHHALADGAATTRLLSSLTRPSPLAERSERTPSPFAKLELAARSIGRALAAMPRLVGRTLEARLAIRRRRRAGGARPAGAFQAPRLAFNGTVTAERKIATKTLDLARFLRLARLRGVTVNDVLLAVVSGALRRYLTRRGELPTAPLVASVPVALSGQQGAGNDLSSIFVALPTDLADPAARLDAVHVSATAAKEELSFQATLGRDWTDELPPLAFIPAMHLVAALGLRLAHPPINLVVSNIRGPRDVVTIAGRELESVHSAGPLVANVGLSITTWSYREAICFGLLAAGQQSLATNGASALGEGRAVDVGELVEDLEPSLAELEVAASGRPRRKLRLIRPAAPASAPGSGRAGPARAAR